MSQFDLRCCVSAIVLDTTTPITEKLNRTRYDIDIFDTCKLLFSTGCQQQKRKERRVVKRRRAKNAFMLPF